MTAFLKIDRCRGCQEERSWEWVPSISLGARPLPGTGVWRSQLTDGLCPGCIAAIEATRQEEREARTQREGLIQLLGGEKPYREFTFERYQVAPGNRLAFEKAKNFNPHQDSLYLWGPCGVGKTHLAYAIARTAFDQRRSVIILRPFQLVRRLRMKDPDEEQALIDRLIQLHVFILDDLGVGHDTAYARQILQEILDGRNFKDRAGLVITSQYSLGGLAQRSSDDTIPSRLAQMCQVFELKGVDYRLSARGARTIP